MPGPVLSGSDLPHIIRALPNAAGPLTTPTYDDSGQAVHPSVVDFGKEWDGYRYWMAMTPFPNNWRLENPSILASNNNVDWVVPRALANPIDPEPGPEQWNADTELVYDGDADQLVCYWKLQDRSRAPDNQCILQKRSRPGDGRTWGPPLEAIGWCDAVVSPTVVMNTNAASGDAAWQMWTVKGDATEQTNSIERRTSDDGNTWSSPAACKSRMDGYVPWHIHVLWAEDVLEYWMLIAGWADGGNAWSALRLLFASSRDGLNWQCGPKPILEPGKPGNWDDFKIYRACSVWDPAEQKLRVWYTGQASDRYGPNGIGYTELQIALDSARSEDGAA